MNRFRRLVKQSEETATTSTEATASAEPETSNGTAEGQATAQSETVVAAPKKGKAAAAEAKAHAEAAVPAEAKTAVDDAPEGVVPDVGLSDVTPVAQAVDGAEALPVSDTADEAGASDEAGVTDTMEHPVPIEVADADLLDADGRTATEAEAVASPEAEVDGQSDLPALDDMDSDSGPLLSADGTSPDAPTGVLTPELVEDQTSPLLPVEREELTALPINAVIDSRYIVQSLLHHGEDRNLYRVTTRKQQRCPTCGRVLAADLELCPRCGTSLSGQAPADFYLMAESYRPDALMQDPDMMESNLYHPNLVPVIDFFSHKPFGHERYYAVAEPRQGVRLSQLSLPRPGGQVLNWAMQLSDALDYLHSRGVVGAGAEADDILVQGDRASLASLQNARSNVENADELTQQQSMDLARLASTMFEAFTGHPAAMSPEGVLPMPSSAPEQVGAAFRAAIEPAQGTAPHISAARWRDMLLALSKRWPSLSVRVDQSASSRRA